MKSERGKISGNKGPGKKTATAKQAAGKVVAKKTPAAKKSAPKKAAQAKPMRKDRNQLIAEAAYLIAHRRGFAGDAALDDWLQAEAEVEARLCS